MQSRTCMLSAFTVSVAMFFAVAAMAADLPKEGTYTGTWTGLGTYKATQVGPDRLLVFYDSTGVWLTNGFLDHMIMRCWGTDDYVKGVGQFVGGYCVGTDPKGDQVVFTCPPSEKHTQNQNWGGSCPFTTGTGKYAGVTGIDTYEVQPGTLRPLAEGTFAFSNPNHGTYKLP
jgi:hypothetical protein